MVSGEKKYLPKAQFVTSNSVLINSEPGSIYPYLENLDFSDARVTYWLFKLRGIPVPKGMTLDGLRQTNFIVLDVVKNERLLLGLIGQFWKPDGNLLHFHPNDFESFQDEYYAKAVWDFRLIKSGNQTKLTTETKIHCLGDHALKRFKWYWLLIKPFSSFTRREILLSIKRKVIT